MTVSKAEYNCLKTMTDDLMEAEYFINNLGVETRTDAAGDTFRNTIDILKDIVTICNNNPTILDDCAEFLAGNPTTSYESDEFQSKYNLQDIYKIAKQNTSLPDNPDYKAINEFVMSVNERVVTNKVVTDNVI